jgi:hypothetical protein
LPNVVHFAFYADRGTVRMLCGKWSPGASWTTAESAVTCPDCLRLLRERKKPGDSET